MGTVVAVETDDGAALAGDSLATHDGTVTSKHVDRVFDFEGVGAAATGDRAGVDEFERELGATLRSERLDRDDPLGLDRVVALAREAAEMTEVEAAVVARDADGVARVRGVGATGAVTEGPVVALGTGAAVALGVIEDADTRADADGAAALARDAVEAAAVRDAETGGEVEVWTLSNDGAGADASDAGDANDDGS
ncbi:20S proteasome subunits A and B [Candidatus Halobonum tyrrellensis]|uniref:20S proteasome subunits A and B n=1 Tax=Candidatus Halobonum tyrrellensis G22 TaxID=1324957 RepID=V4HA08_9EURY|nr:20S proteasome subunits A and B [Candidatus Halobonum tyrrellensis]ESP86878.1 20S proteasome subunits A and B [Candidatus Halobonum tyrrellensis G22]